MSCKAIILEGVRKGQPCTFPPSENSYCGRHQRHYEHEQLTNNGKIPCRFFFRGCNQTVEKTGACKWVYHVLGGHIAPLDGIEPGDLTIEQLVERIRKGSVKELVMATNPNMAGDGTALYISSLIKGIDKPRDNVLMSLGWLAREGHVVLQQIGSDYKISLRK